jgi:hypothetical protein
MKEMPVRNLWVYIACTMLFFYVSCPSYILASLDTIGVETEGTYPLYGNDQSAARDGAIDDAMKKAVERVVGMLVSQEPATETLDLLVHTIYPKHQQYVQDYRILSEGIDDGLYHVRIRATLSQSAIKNDLKAVGIFTEGLPSDDEEPSVVSVTIHGIERCRDYHVLKETLLKNIRGVNAVRPRRMGSGVAVMDVEMRGGAALLAKELQFQEFSGFMLYVAQMSRDTIEFNMAKE